jgi:hypothetical protein
MSEMKLKVSEKGGVSLYGLGRFPVTLYKAQWEKLLGEVDNIRRFLDENADKLAVKEWCTLERHRRIALNGTAQIDRR